MIERFLAHLRCLNRDVEDAFEIFLPDIFSDATGSEAIFLDLFFGVDDFRLEDFGGGGG
jgi:hypothetical protein